METPTKQITDLPIEILSYILKLLPYADLQNARLVSSSFYHSSLNISSVTRDVVKFDNYKNLQPASLVHCNRNFRHFRFENVMLPPYDEGVWSILGPKLKSLTFTYCTFTEDNLFAILDHCTGLKNLEIVTCGVEISSKTAEEPCSFEQIFGENSSPLLNLEAFSIHRILDVRIFWKILRRSPNLKSLYVGKFKVHVRSITPEVHRPQTPTSIPTILEDIVVYLNAYGHQLLDLRLILHSCDLYSPTSSKAVLTDTLSQMTNLHLRSLHTNVFLHKEFFINQKNCQSLKLDNVMVDMLPVICRELKNLKHLDVQTVLSTESEVKNFRLLKNLVSLSLMLYYPLTFVETDIFTALCGEPNTTLKELELLETEDKVMFTPECLIGIIHSFPALTHLNLRYCDGVTDTSVQTIFRCLESLESLQLHGCRKLTDAGLSGSAMTSSESSAEKHNRHSLASLKRLQVLDLSYCQRVNGKAFTPDLKLPEIRSLNISFIKMSPLNLICFLKNHPTIEKLDVTGTLKLTDDVVDVIVQYLRRPKLIRIEKYSDMSLSSLQLLKKHCRRVVDHPRAYLAGTLKPFSFI